MRLLILFTLLCSTMYTTILAQCATESSKAVHVVQEQETLYSIAKQHHISLKNLCKWNQLTAEDVINVCQQLKIQAPTESYNTKKASTEEEIMDRPERPYVPKPMMTKGKLDSEDEILSLKSLEMIKEINMLRANPKAYIPYIEEYVNSFKGTAHEIETETVEELIQELKNTKRLPTLNFSDCVFEAAKIHAEELKKRNEIDHKGKDGSQPWERIKGCGTFADGNENFVWGANKIRNLIIILLIDNGTETRAHRNNLLHPRWTHVACYPISEIQGHKHFWVQNFAEEIE